VVEGARLESKAGEQHGATPKRLNARAISDFAYPNDHPMCVRKPRCSSRLEADVSQSYHNPDLHLSGRARKCRLAA
jgi:hypothetical protein